jgi:hypothetical protein
MLLNGCRMATKARSAARTWSEQPELVMKFAVKPTAPKEKQNETE